MDIIDYCGNIGNNVCTGIYLIYVLFCRVTYSWGFHRLQVACKRAGGGGDEGDVCYSPLFYASCFLRLADAHAGALAVAEFMLVTLTMRGLMVVLVILILRLMVVL